MDSYQLAKVCKVCGRWHPLLGMGLGWVGRCGWCGSGEWGVWGHLNVPALRCYAVLMLVG